MGKKLPKREKLGIHAVVEKYCLGLLTEAITATFSGGQTKVSALRTARIYSHIIANLLRTENELGVLVEKKYMRLSYQTTEIGKMFSGWITYETQKESR